MEKRRVRLEIGGVPVSLWTDETDEYMARLAHEVETQMEAASTPQVGMTDRSAVMAALVLCDQAVRAREEIVRMQRKLAACEEELRAEADRAEILRASLARLEAQGSRPRSRKKAEDFAVYRNPFKPVDYGEQQGLQSFFEINADATDADEETEEREGADA